MKALLVVQEGPGAGHTYPLDPHMQSLFSMGRGAGCDIVVLDHRASRHHCDVRWNGRQWEVRGPGEHQRHTANGLPLMAHEPYALQPGDRLSLGDSVLVLDRLRLRTRYTGAGRARERHKLPVPSGDGLAVLVIVTSASAAFLYLGRGGTRTYPAPIVVTRVIVVRPPTVRWATASPTESHARPPHPAGRAYLPQVSRSRPHRQRRRLGRFGASTLAAPPPTRCRSAIGTAGSHQLARLPPWVGLGGAPSRAVPVSCFWVRLQADLCLMALLRSRLSPPRLHRWPGRHPRSV